MQGEQGARRVLLIVIGAGVAALRVHQIVRRRPPPDEPVHLLTRCRPAKAINQNGASRTHDPDSAEVEGSVLVREHEPGHGSARPTCSFTRAAQVGMCDDRMAFDADVLYVLVVLGPELWMAEVVPKVQLD